MSPLAKFYPGHVVVDLFVIVVAAVSLVTAAAWIVSLFLERHPAVRHWVLLSALVASLATPLLASAFVASGTSFIAVPLLAAVESPSAQPGVRGDARPSDDRPPLSAPENFLPESAPGPAVAGPSPDKLTETDPFRATVVAVLLLWLCGTVVSIVGLARSGLFLHRLRRSVQPVSDAELGGAFNEAARLLGARTSPAVVVPDCPARQ